MRTFDRRLMLAAVAVSSLTANGALAGDLADTSFKDMPVFRTSTFSLDAALGVKTGKANEYVFNENGSKASQLIWKYDNNTVLSGGATWTPLHWLALGAKGSINLNKSSVMDDWDWNQLAPTHAGSAGREEAGCHAIEICHSHHEDTTLKRDTSVDLSAAGTVFRNDGISVAGLVGYKWNYSHWQAYNGTANYAPYEFSGLVISYEQWWETPYIGLQAKADFGKWSLGAKVIGSWWVSSHDEDNHHLRQVLFAEKFGTSDMIGASAEVGYKVSDALTLSVTYDYQRWDRAKGPEIWTAYGTSTETSGSTTYDGAGADNTTHTISLGMNYKF